MKKMIAGRVLVLAGVLALYVPGQAKAEEGYTVVQGSTVWYINSDYRGTASFANMQGESVESAAVGLASVKCIQATKAKKRYSTYKLAAALDAARYVVLTATYRDVDRLCGLPIRDSERLAESLRTKPYYKYSEVPAPK